MRCICLNRNRNSKISTKKAVHNSLLASMQTILHSPHPFAHSLTRNINGGLMCCVSLLYISLCNDSQWNLSETHGAACVYMSQMTATVLSFRTNSGDFDSGSVEPYTVVKVPWMTKFCQVLTQLNTDWWQVDLRVVRRDCMYRKWQRSIDEEDKVYQRAVWLIIIWRVWGCLVLFWFFLFVCVHRTSYASIVIWKTNVNSIHMLMIDVNQSISKKKVSLSKVKTNSYQLHTQSENLDQWLQGYKIVLYLAEHEVNSLVHVNN